MPHEPLAASSKPYRNPIAVAHEWQRLLRARVTRILGLLQLTPEVVDALAALGDPLPKPLVTERGLRALLGVPAKEQMHVLQATVSKAGAS